MQASGLLLHLGSYHWAGNLWVLIIYLFFPPSYVALSASKAHYRQPQECFLLLGNFCLFKTPFLEWSSIPTSFVSLFVFNTTYLLLKTMGCSSGCLMSSASIQKLFCGIYSAFKCSFDEFVEEKVVSPSYSSTILGQPPTLFFNERILPKSTIRKHKYPHYLHHKQQHIFFNEHIFFSSVTEFIPWKLFSSVKFSHLVVSNTLRHHESQHTRPPCPSPTPGVH